VDITVLDAAVGDALRSVASPALTWAMWATTLLGDTAVMVVHTLVACALLWAWGSRREAGVLAAAMVVGPAVSATLKALLARPRPPVAQALIAMPGNGSLPSGHALAGLLFYGTLALFVLARARRGAGRGPASIAGVRPMGAVLLLTVGLAIGVSRVVLGVHWATDVLLGWVIASGLLAAVWRVMAPGGAAGGPQRADGNFSLRGPGGVLRRPDELALTAFGIVLAGGVVLIEAVLAPLL
jgi:membrane-associated phospholipid phosphatase